MCIVWLVSRLGSKKNLTLPIVSQAGERLSIERVAAKIDKPVLFILSTYFGKLELG